MKKHSQDQESILRLLNEIYLELADIEERFKLLAGAGDMRPRIDYFHDAIRAFTEGGEHHPRLSVELLAYDLQCLRYLIKMPLSPFRDSGGNLSPSKEVITTDIDIIATKDRPDRKAKTRITELYQHYAVMFSALLKPAADRDYHERTDSLNQDAHDIHALIHQFEGKADAAKIASLAANTEEAEIRMIISTFLAGKRQQNKEDVKKLLGHLKNYLKQKDATLKAIDNAHLKFSTSQLGVFEDSKDLLKKLAAQGMNLVGKFVEASVAATKREMGR